MQIKMFEFLLRKFVVVIGIAHTVVSQNLGEEGPYFQGDILGISPAFLQKTSGLILESYRWPNAIIPYEFEATYPPSSQISFLEAMEHISSHSCIKFVPRSNQTDYLEVMSGVSCYAAVGRMGGKQLVSLPEGCTSLGIMAHEIMHSIGFFHEQSRLDRDSYVDIQWENVKLNMVNNLDIYPGSEFSTFRLGYDYDSLMHFDLKAFSKNGEDTILTIPRGIPIGNRKGMSSKDILKVNKMYGCDMH